MISRIYEDTQYRRELYSKLDNQRARRSAIMGWTGDRYEVYYAYDIRLFLKKRGFAWDPDARCWHTENPKVAVHAIRYANPETRRMILYYLT